MVFFGLKGLGLLILKMVNCEDVVSFCVNVYIFNVFVWFSYVIVRWY